MKPDQMMNLKINHRPRLGLRVSTHLRSGIQLGDAFANFTKFTGLDRFARLFTQTTGLDCGCKARQEQWNQLL